MEAVEQAARLALRAIYEQADAAVAADTRLVCELSGRCCRFAQAGHELFLTRLEYREMERCGGPRPASAEACPWLEGGLCGNRDGRALACRTYFCSDEGRAAAITEQWHRAIRALHDQAGLEYDYRPLHKHMNPAG